MADFDRDEKLNMKFEPVCKQGRGLYIRLCNAQGEPVGSISSCYISSNRGPFSANLSKGYLTAKVSVFDMHTAREECVMEFENSDCRTRQEADNVVREWIRTENVREKLIAAALELARQLACANEVAGH